jgi:hypothetical protein
MKNPPILQEEAQRWTRRYEQLRNPEAADLWKVNGPPKRDTYFGSSRQYLQDCTERHRPRFVRYRCTYSRHRFQS